MSMDVTFLGTGSAYPSPHRGASALVLRTQGDCWLFDCGEGTQTQLMKSQLRAGRITKVFISHLHGDHLFGLPGLLCTVSLNTNPEQQSLSCVEIYGPRGLRHFLRVTLGLTGSQLLFPYAVHELEPTADQSPEEGQLSPEMTAECGPLHPQEQPGRTIFLDPSRARSTRKTEDGAPEGTRHKTGAALWAAESRQAGNAGERPRRSVQRGAARSHSWSESLHLWGLQLGCRGRAAEAVPWSGRPGPRGHTRGRAPRESRGPRTQYAGNGGRGGPGLLRPEAGAVPLQPEVQTRLLAEGRGRG
ncbi:zinc phosphodiesterase ELAC protein 1 isoform X2 [Clinocottus analis]|uniref:zinc phosphodiesterase ELAC protein 1 isoform X2 n=1 Tax=Clinocottus analis TaxID=304258 RepID=UPI0035C0656B